LEPSVPDDDCVARKNGKPDGRPELSWAVSFRSYSTHELPESIEHTDLGRNLFQDSESSVSQPGGRYRTRPLVLWFSLHDSDPNVRHLGECDGCMTLEHTRRELLDQNTGRIRDH
jgi:hypothetical protein